MRFRDYYFKREATVADSDTVVIDINVKDPISYITVEYEATNGATSALDHEIHDDVTTIELVDGSEVLWSLSMAQARALNFFELKQLPHHSQSEAGGAVQEEKCVLHFGRFPDDPEFYFDPTKYRNPQLRLTHNLTISATAGFATGTGKVTVMARLIEKGAGPHRGMMSAKVRKSWTTAGSGDEEIELPRDLKYRMMLIQALLSTYTPQEIISKLKMSCDGDKYVPFELYTEDIVDMNLRLFGMARQFKTLYRADAESALLDLYDIRSALARPASADTVVQVAGVDAEQVTINGMTYTTTPTIANMSTDSVPVVAEGLAPYACLAIPFGSLQDPDDWFDPTEFGDIRLYATQATASASAAVILQQVRTS